MQPMKHVWSALLAIAFALVLPLASAADTTSILLRPARGVSGTLGSAGLRAHRARCTRRAR